MDFLVERATGRLLISLDYPRPITDTPSAKLQSVQTVRVQYAEPGPTGTAYVLCAAPDDALKFGLKPKAHYSDLVFDVFTDAFTAPEDPTLADAFYTGTLTIDSDALRALFPVADDGTSADFVPLIGEILSGTAPSQTFAFNAQNNVIKGDEAPGQAVAGPSGYASAASVNAVVTPYLITGTSGTQLITPGARAVVLTVALTGALTGVLPDANSLTAGQCIVFTDPGYASAGHAFSVGPRDADQIVSHLDSGTRVIFDGSGPQQITVVSDGVSRWDILRADRAATAVPSTTGLVLDYPLDESAGPQLTNARRAKSPASNLFASPETSAFGSSGITEHAVGASGLLNALHWAPGAGNQYLSQSITLTVGHTYVVSALVRNNESTARTIKQLFNGAFTSGVSVPGNGAWTPVTSTFTATASGSQLVVPVANDGATAIDVNVDAIYLVESPVPVSYETGAGNLSLTGTTARVAGGVNFNGTGYAIGSVPPVALSGVTIYVPFKWPTANNPSDAGYAGLLGSQYGGNGVYLAALDVGVPSFHFSGVNSHTGPASPLVSFRDSNAHIATGCYDGVNVQLWLDDVLVDVNAASVPPAVLDLVQLGSLNVGTGKFPGTIYGSSRLYALGHSPAQMARVRAELIAELAASGVSVAAVTPSIVHFKGDSITAGGTGASYAPVAAALLPAGVIPRNLAVSGSSLNSTGNSLTARAAGEAGAYDASRSRNVISVLIGRNDFFNYSTNPAGFVADLGTYLAAQAAQAPNVRIVLCTLLPSTLTNYNAWRNAVNPGLRTLAAANGYFLADVAADATIGGDTAAGTIGSTDPSPYSADGTHPNQAGANISGPIVAAAINAALA